MPVIGYYNGKFLDPTSSVVPIEERGHEFGDGVYEVIRVYGGQPFLLDWHIERLLNSLHAIRIPSPHDADGYKELIVSAIQRSAEEEASIYLQVTRGAAARNHLFPADTTVPSVSLVVRPLSAKPDQKPGKLLIQPDERWANSYIKTLNLLPNILAKQAAHDAGADEALLVRDGHMIESASSNLWFVRDGKLITAPTDRFILPGITRRYVLELAGQLDIPVEQVKLPLSELSSVDGIFITGTILEILPIESVLSHPVFGPLDTLQSGSPHPLDVKPEECEVIWRARDLSVVEQLRQAFDAGITAFRAATSVSI
ncbi:aminotransferase class IV [Alicyclobacillus dauci]|uniref:Aminotransferase class IV n=1 Tax=Alicyclobacillus dauci TaxID=1475485 RepID=A0ABY6YYT4_9BACL|nr:aminotransferase class IV [Alicyclobacillus dauci]WAH35779.1 aminotransferase class IV [Alicyclobacillus dauci]